jgi:EAL domain-containing protein (putative c-di-GMP-specific phosphodiesterase class I)/GGDEF domain-containing protein
VSETGISRNHQLEAELARVQAELEATRQQLDLAQGRLAEQTSLINLNPDTGLPIHRVFYRELEQLVEANNGDSQPFAIAQVRLDSAYQRIKNSKDRSHALLFKTTVRIREETGDSLYQSDRLDEFMIILRDFGSVNDLRKRLGGMVREVAKPHDAVNEVISFGCQVGFSVYPQHGTNSQELLMNAEIALRYAVHSQKAVVAYSGALGKAFYHLMRLEQELHRATQTGFEHFFMVYQPFVDASNTIRGCESLIRWNHPELGFIPPPNFIPLAERSGVIRLIGRWILYQSCRQLSDWIRRGYSDLFVSVNLSPAQFVQKDLVEQVTAVLESTGLEGRHLKLEITEGALMDKPEDAIVKLNALRSHGIRISIDDFGTGYSSLNYLRKLPIDTLKIDKSFIDDVTTNVQNQQIVRAIISMATSLDIETLAEGVETEAQKNLILAEGCKYIQGYYFSKPVTPDRFNEYLAKGGVLPYAD